MKGFHNKMKSGKRKIRNTRTKHIKSLAAQKHSKSGPVKQDKSSVQNKSAKHHEISKSKLWLFRVIAVTVIPVLFLLMTELILRVVGFGYSPTPVVKYNLNGKSLYCYNPKFGWTFFPKNIARESDAFVFEMPKKPETYRIFILGASAAYGEPDQAYSFGRILNVMLEKKFDGIDFEVINLGTAAINSHVVLKMARDCAKYDPDLFVVYLGNNEVVGPYGPGTVFAPISSNLSAIRTNINLKSTKLGQLMQDLVTAIKPKDNTLKTWGGLEMFLDHQVRFDSSALKYVYNHYEQNLKDICKAAIQADAKIILCNVGSNLKDCPPFASLHNLDITDSQLEQWEILYQKAVEFESKEKYSEALQTFLQAAEIDQDYAELQYQIAECYRNLGDIQNAKDRYIQARDKDTLRLRADTQINKIVRLVAEGKSQKGIYFVDTISNFEKNSSNKIPGRELFFEHVHFNFQGNYILAKSVYEQIAEILPEKIIKTKNNQDLPSVQDCMSILAYTGWDQYRVVQEMLDSIISRPPFTNQLNHAQHVKKMEQQIESLSHYTQNEGLQQSADIYKTMTERYPTDWKLNYQCGYFLMEALGDYDGATEQFRKVIRQLPNYMAYNSLAILLFNKGRINESIESFKMGLKIKPTDDATHYNLARVLEQKQDYKGALRHYSRALEINPEISPNAYILLARILIINQEQTKAIEVLNKSVEIFPDVSYCYFVLATLYVDAGQKEKAIEVLNKVLKIEPDYEEAEKLLQQLTGGN